MSAIRNSLLAFVAVAVLASIGPVARANDKTPHASTSKPSVARSGTPDICPLRDIRSSEQSGLSWLTLTETFQGQPPVKPSTGAVTISKVQLQGVYLGSAFATTNAATVTTLEAYLKYLAGSPYVTALSPYGVVAGTAVTGKVINATLPLYAASSAYLLDSDIANYLATNINNGTLVTPTASTVYVVYIEPGVAVDVGGGQTSINAFLGYHNTGQFTNTKQATQTIYYAVLPFPGSPNPTPSSQGFSNAMDGLTAVTSHEVAESITDPDTVNGWQETLKETIAIKIFGWTLFKFTFLVPDEEIADVPLILNNYSSACYARLNGYLVQKVIATDGVNMITPTGAVAAAAIKSSVSQPAKNSIQVMGATLSLPW